MAKYGKIRTDKYWFRKDDGTRVLVSRHEAFQDTGFDYDGPYPAPIGVWATPSGGDTAIRIPLTWWNFTRSINTPEAWEWLRTKAQGWVNKAGNDAFPKLIPDDLSTWTEDMPRTEGITSVGNKVKIIGEENNSWKIETFKKSDMPLVGIDWHTHPHLFCRFTSIAKDGAIGLAPQGVESFFPLVTANGYGYIQKDAVQLVTEEPQMAVKDTYAQGIDLSQHNVATKNPDGSLTIHPYVHKKPLDFVALRASIGYLRDAAFSSLLQDTQMIPIRGAWHYSYVSYDWQRQADTLLSVAAGTGMHFLAWDYEKIGNTLTKATDDVALKTIEYLKEQSGLPVFLYSNLATVSEMYNRGSKWVLDVPLWGARWFSSDHYYKPTTISPYSSSRPSWMSASFFSAAHWNIWQYGGDKASYPIPGKGQGAEYGVISASVELDAYNGTPDEMRAFLKIGDIPTPPEPPEPTDAEKLSILWDDYLRRQ